MRHRAYRLDLSQGLSGLRRQEEVSVSPGPGQISIAIRAVSLNFRDLLIAEGRYGRDVKGDYIPLSDGAGEVVAVGEGVDRFRPGDRVTPGFSSCWAAGPPSATDLALTHGSPAVDGVLTECFVCDAAIAARIPDHLSYEEAACLPCAGVTAWNALYGPRPIKVGDTVLTLGTGGVSCFAIQFAKAAGARVISTSSSAAKLQAARRLGAWDVINYREEPDWEKAVLELTGGRGVDHVVEVGGGGTLEKSIAATAISGQVHMIGVLTDGAINPRSLIGWRALRGVTVGSRSDLDAMNRMIALHTLRPQIDRVFDFNEAPAAFHHLKAAGHVGKIVIKV
ncbi:Alcohol dehydrogenase [Brevundimonas sp. SH203]|uniref:zinc-dependent alcohol dehydrogenase family protein n=1 Tax=Brevundimonas sp. SH203 TaxID=345167 RepID=UPI0009D1C868|nr:NAD(P)-dependent alcohol dehydrogenase [Brevundimonas sp. SH203]GAW40286.1 Alcohol dehydrogenase [Brevundimonas sp. SH203]